MSDPRAPRTQGIQTSTSAPNALGRAIQASSRVETVKRAMAAGGDGDHDHENSHDGGSHQHDHLESRLTDHEGRIANLEGQHGSHGDGTT